MKKAILTPVLYLFIVTFSLANISCKKIFDRKSYGIFKVIDDNTAEMDGTIGRKSLKRFNKMLKKYPNITTINIKNCDGSSDDDTNLKLSSKVHKKGINIHLMDNGSIASGGVDFFLAGIKRTKGSNTQIGVHSWSDGSNNATDFPVGHENHQPYINYYKCVGFSEQEASDFYYFTINAAPAESIHWMTDSEITQYNILNP